MKELSIEEKAKRYDEAIEAARDVYTYYCDDMEQLRKIESIFPELKESEDDGIRKWIINEIKIKHHNLDEDNVDFVDKAIAWLEKQVPIDEEKILIGARKNVALSIMNFLDKNTLGMCLSNMECEDLEDAVVDSDWSKVYDYMKKKLEKQCEQKVVTWHDVSEEPEIYVELLCKCKSDYRTWYNVAFYNAVSKSFEYGICQKVENVTRWCYIADLVDKQESDSYCKKNCKGYQETGKCYADGDCEAKRKAEQMSTDNAKPKFKVGDYVVGKYISGYISEVRDDCYLLDYQGFSIDKQDNYHLWTIKDTKDGDVLKEDSCIFIIKRMESNGTAIVYCCLFDDGDFILGSTLGFDVGSTYPATKEQRDLLFSKMKEEGYEWDAEKKELKKIDNEEIDGEDYGIDGLWHAQRILEETLGSVDGYQTDDGILEHKAAITAVKKLYRQKPSWSEEDKKMIDDAIGAIAAADYYAYDDKQEIENWLKSLKARYTWKPSEQQIRSLEYIINNTNNKSYSYNMTKDLLADLKKLKGE